MSFAKITLLIWQIISMLVVLKLDGWYINADTGEDFLNAVISELKESQLDGYLPLEDIFTQTKRSSQEYKIKESEEYQENALDEQNANFNDENFNQEFNNQGENLQHLVNQSPNPLFDHQVNQLFNLQQQQQQQQQLDNHPYDLNGVQTLPQDANLPAQHLQVYAAGLQGVGPINPDLLQQYNIGAPFGVNDPLLLQNNGQLVGNEVAQNEPLVPMHYYFNHHSASDNTIDDNLLDEAINAMKTPYGDHLLAGQEPGKKFVVEPLFVAMAGFVGIAMIFMSAVLFLPKLITPHPTVNGLRGPQELAALTKLAVEAIEGNDCTERIACEVGRAMRSMQVGSQPIKMIEVILPANMAKQLAQIRKAVASKQTCKLIHCKKIANPELKSKIITGNKKAPSKPELKAEPKKNDS